MFYAVCRFIENEAKKWFQKKWVKNRIAFLM